MLWTFMLTTIFFNIWLTLLHVADMSTTFPTKLIKDTKDHNLTLRCYGCNIYIYKLFCANALKLLLCLESTIIFYLFKGMSGDFPSAIRKVFTIKRYNSQLHKCILFEHYFILKINFTNPIIVIIKTNSYTVTKIVEFVFLDLSSSDATALEVRNNAVFPLY